MEHESQKDMRSRCGARECPEHVENTLLQGNRRAAGDAFARSDLKRTRTVRAHSACNTTATFSLGSAAAFTTGVDGGGVEVLTRRLGRFHIHNCSTRHPHPHPHPRRR